MKNKILNIAICTILFLSLNSCITSKDNLRTEQKTSYENVIPADRKTYNIIGKTTGSSGTFKVWLLFIPIGGSSDRGLYDRCYKEAVQGGDAILLPHFTYKKVKVPLLLVTFVYKKAKVEGLKIKMKTDNQIENEE